MASIRISEHDQFIICETVEDILRKNPGSTRFFRLWTKMRKERHELNALHKKHKKVMDCTVLYTSWQYNVEYPDYVDTDSLRDVRTIPVLARQSERILCQCNRGG